MICKCANCYMGYRIPFLSKCAVCGYGQGGFLDITNKIFEKLLGKVE